MPYAAVTDVQARAGALLNDLTAAPTSAQVESFVEECDGQIDSALAGHGHAVPITAPAHALAALRALSADGALVLAMDARYERPDDQDEPHIRREAAEKRWSAGIAGLTAGEHPVLAALDASTASTSLATSWGADEDPCPNDHTLHMGMIL